MNNFKEIKKFIISFLKKHKNGSNDSKNINMISNELFVEKLLVDLKKEFFESSWTLLYYWGYVCYNKMYILLPTTSSAVSGGAKLLL